MTFFYDKVAPELISLDRDALAAVDVPTMQDKVNKQSLKKENIGITNDKIILNSRQCEPFITITKGG